MAKLPAIQFYPGDWKKDVGVQSLSFHDRGVWFEILMLMHDSPVRGKLLLGSKAMSDEVLAGILRIDIAELQKTLDTLISRGVTEREKRTGSLISRRMLRDDSGRSEIRQKMHSWRKAKKEKGNGNDVVTEMLPLSSTSSSTSTSILTPPPPESQEIAPEMLAKAVQVEARIFGIDSLDALTQVCRAEIADGGEPESIRDRMVRAWQEFTEAKPRLQYAWGAEKFFGEGNWKKPDGWPWKQGQAPPPKRKYLGEAA